MHSPYFLLVFLSYIFFCYTQALPSHLVANSSEHGVTHLIERAPPIPNKEQFQCDMYDIYLPVFNDGEWIRFGSDSVYFLKTKAKKYRGRKFDVAARAGNGLGRGHTLVKINMNDNQYGVKVLVR
jgi:hypothetical protein